MRSSTACRRAFDRLHGGTLHRTSSEDHTLRIGCLVHPMYLLWRDLRLHPTLTPSYLLANASPPYGLRTEIRSKLLSVLVPGVGRLAPVFGGFAPFAVI